MVTQLTFMLFITIFVNCITGEVQVLSMLVTVLHNTFNQLQMICIETVYKGSYDNLQPSCTNPHKVTAVHSKC